LKGGALNIPPTEKLDIYVCGDGESGQLGLGPKPFEGKKPTNVKRPRRNRLLDATTVGVVMVAAGGMHCVSLTHDQKIITWGVNDNGALGRDTTWEAPTRDIDQESNSEDSDDEADLSPKEITPTAIPTEIFGKIIPTFVHVVASDNASFVLTSEALVYGWGTFRVGLRFEAAVKLC
jgi:regulator of chromosome condensation